MQTRLQSLIETCTNVGSGYFVGLLTQLVVFPLYGLEVTLSANLQIGVWFTLVMVAKSYAVRRGFNWWHHYAPARIGGDRTYRASPPREGADGGVSR